MEQNTIKKEQVEKNFLQEDIKINNNKKYKINFILNYILYANKIKDYLLCIYCLII